MASQSPKEPGSPGEPDLSGALGSFGALGDFGALQGLSAQTQLIGIFDVLVNVMFCIKNRDNRYVAVNAAFVRRTGRRSKRDVIGHMANELFSPELAERYEEQDATVFSTGKALRDQLELIRRPDGSLGWYLTTKLPIFHPSGAPVEGIVSVSRDLDTPSGEGIAVASLSNVVKLVKTKLDTKLRVIDLAAAADCTPAQLQRRMKRVFGLTPTQYILRVRVDQAAELLTETNRPLAEVATACGFYDQAEFTHKFVRLTNETPSKFRTRHNQNR